MSVKAQSEQLNDYFSAELNSLRTRALEFANDNPSIAEELLLSKNNEGKSSDPHIEILIQSFAWLTSRLRQNIESEAAKLPAMMLQQLYPQLVSSIPSMSIAQFDLTGDGAVFDQGYLLPAHKTIEPIKIEGSSTQQKRLRQCKMSTCYDSRLWPLLLTELSKQALNDHGKASKLFPKSQSIVRMKIKKMEECNSEIYFHHPVRFYLNFDEEYKFKAYDYFTRHFIGAVVSDENGQKLRLDEHCLKPCGFADDERLFPDNPHQDLGFTLLQDYFSFPEKFLFFELEGLAGWHYKSELTLLLMFDENPHHNMKWSVESLQLNCVPVINLFEKTTEPLPIHFKDYRFKLYPSREHYECYEIISVKQLHAVNKKGETKELTPYFSLSNDNKSSLQRWLTQQERGHLRHVSGTETWLSLFDADFQNDSPIGETVFANTWCCNRSVCEQFNPSQKFSVVGTSPVSKVKLLTKPTRHKNAQVNKDHLWKMLSHLSVYYVSLTDPKLAKDMLTKILRLYASSDSPITQRQIDSIDDLEVEDDVQPHQTGAWKGYYHGTKFTLTLSERKFEGNSPLLFGCVIHQFLALFCHINSFVRLELKFGERSIYQWQPMSGHQMLI